MGKEKQTSSTTNVVNQTTTPTPTAEERELIQLQLGQAKAFDPLQRQLNEQGGNLILNLLQGKSLPGYLNTLPGGISEDVVSSISNQAIQDIAPTFQKSGILDSGTAAQISARTSADIRNQASQFNIQNLMQLLNQAIGGQAQVQAPAIQTSAQLGNSLAGLRSMNTQGTTTSNTTLTMMNPFLNSFQQSLGKTLGSPKFKGPFGVSF